MKHLSPILLLALAACPDPAKNKPKADVAPAVQQPALKPLEGAVAYTFSNDASKLEWVGAKVTSKHDGGFSKFSGTVELVDNAPAKSRVKVDIDMASVFCDAEKLTKHLQSEDFFDVPKFPSATFVSTEVKEGGANATHTITGALTLHGVTKQISFPANITLAEGEVKVAAEFAINRKDFGILYPGKPDNLIADDVLIKLNLLAKKG